MIGKRIIKLISSFSLGMGLMSIVYRDNNLIFLLCMGREEWFKFDLENLFTQFVGGTSLNMENAHPFRVLLNTATFSFVFVVPVLYYKIFHFRKVQDSGIQGITISAHTNGAAYFCVSSCMTSAIVPNHLYKF